ncbi:PREDICTED: guanylate cyclase 32E-like isoform X2 [Priapulus caudatus]|uniref:Guanylate cyclase 32E-like isoform X2 n=1 Tax=Priapulus caudatus TaxID=37621 RepID=A0ABM1E827_PRICU|nr:PREDICTED: guanylate cyclase 32E-like isoform X2 [Priapulus caudatus]
MTTHGPVLLRVIVRLLWLLWTAELLRAENFTIGYITGSARRPGNNEYNRPGLAISGAITLAVNEINANPDLLPNDYLNFAVAETYGESAESLKQTALFWQSNAAVIIGPQETCVCEATLAGSFGIPMVSYYCPETVVSNKYQYPTFARTRPPDYQISKSLAALLKYFNWTTVAVLSSDASDFSNVATTIIKILKASGIDVATHRTWQGTYYHDFTENPFVKLVEETLMDARIYVVIGKQTEYIGLMTYMEERQLLNGDYFVVGVHFDQYNPEDPEEYIKGVLQTHVDTRSRRAFQSYIGIISSAPVYPAFQHFSAKVDSYLESPPFSHPNPFKTKGLDVPRKINQGAAHLYDAVYLYARAVHQAEANHDDPLNGHVLINYMKEQTYLSAMGYMTSTDENADAKGNYTLIAFSRLPGAEARYGLTPVGTFEHMEPGEGETIGLPRLRIYDRIPWRGRGPPAAVPACGFRGVSCPNNNIVGQISV